MDNTANIYFIPSYPYRGITFIKGEEKYLLDPSGKKYLDLGSNYGVNIFGYNHKKITQALENQLHTLINLHGSFGNDVRTEAAKKLLDRCPDDLSRVFFSNSGTEAIEAALKFTRLASGKSHIIAMKNSYHGKTLGALSVTGSLKYREPFLPLLWNVTHVDFGNIEALKKEITKDTAAVICEPIQGEGGIILPPLSYLIALQKLCKKQGILLIIDEIQTGAGRTGAFLASELFGLSPDILCLGKGIAGGIPVGVTLVTESIAQKIPLHAHTSTFGGNPLACRGIIAALDELNKPLLTHIKTVGKNFLSKLKMIKHPSIVAVRGLGLMIAIELTGSATPILKALQKEYIIAIPAGSSIIRFLPPYLITKRDIDKTYRVLKNIFSHV